jgi:hypothetical protein
MPSEANTQGRGQAFDKNPIREAAFGLVGQRRDKVA